MNPAQLEQLLLLEQSGELTDKQRRVLDAELAASEPARRLRAGLRGLAAALPEPAARPDPDAAAKIAARLAQTQSPATVFPSLWKPVLAVAAVVALLLGLQAYRGGTWRIPSEPLLAQAGMAEENDWADPLDAQFEELESLLLAILDEPYDYMEL